MASAPCTAAAGAPLLWRIDGMTKSRYERTFEASGKAFAALLNEQDDGRFSVTVRLPDDSLRTVPGEHFASADAAMVAAHAFAHELVGSC
jgi:hypothetical protein